MPQSYKEYSKQELSTKTYNVPFKYININDVHVIGFDGNTWTPLALDASNPTNEANKTVTLANTPPASFYQKIRLYRATSTSQLVDFQNGSRLSERDLDTAYQQGLFAAQEISEDASTTQFSAVASQGLIASTSLSNFASEGFTGDGSTKVFTIGLFSPQTERQEAYRVSIDGVMQSPIDSYNISMANSTITFLGTAAPPAGSKIVVVTAASAASSVSVDNVTIGLTSANTTELKNGAVTSAKLSDFIDDDTFTTGVSSTSLASSESIKAYVDTSVSNVNSSGSSSDSSSDILTTTSGTAPYYGCRAWASFNGLSTASTVIQASGNVASITRNNVGLYTVVFTTAMPSEHYSIVIGGSDNLNNNNYPPSFLVEGEPETTGFVIRVHNVIATSYTDQDHMSFAVFA